MQLSPFWFPLTQQTKKTKTQTVLIFLFNKIILISSARMFFCFQQSQLHQGDNFLSESKCFPSNKMRDCYCALYVLERNETKRFYAIFPNCVIVPICSSPFSSPWKILVVVTCLFNVPLAFCRLSLAPSKRVLQAHFSWKQSAFPYK